MTVNAWNAATAYPQPRHSQAGCEWDDLFVVCGGTTIGTFATMFSEVYAYDHTTTSWTARNNMPITRCEHAAVQVGGEMFVMGGQGGGSSYNTRVDKCVMSTDTWSTVSAAPYGARWPRAAVLNGDIHLIGGDDPGAGGAVTTHALYDVSADSWSTLAALPAGRRMGALVAAGGYLHYLGGTDGSSTLVDTHYVYDPVGDSWSTGTALPVAMAELAAWVDATGRIWVSAGRDATDATEPLYRLDGASWTTVETTQPNARYRTAYARVGHRLHRVGGTTAGSAYTTTHYYWEMPSSTDRPRLRGGQVIYGELRGGQRWN